MTGEREPGPALGDAHVRRALLGRGRPTRSTGATWPRGRPACRSPSTCRPRPATTPITRWRGARSARSACRSRTSATCGAVRRHPARPMNTSMTINATAMWLLALYQVVAEEQAASTRRRSPGTTQNDIIKEYLSRGTYVFPPGPVAAADHGPDRLHGRRACRSGTRSTSAATTCRRPGRRPCRSWRSRCATAIAVLDAVRDSGQVPPSGFGRSSARITFFVNAGVRFVEEMCKMRAFVELWDELHARALRRDGREAAPLPLRRPGQLARAHRGQPENNVQRIVLEMLGVTLSQGRPRPRGAAARLERGARPAAAVGPAVVAAHPAGPRVRDRPARVRRPVRRLAVVEARSAELVEAARAEIAGCSAWAAPSPPSRPAT